MLVDGFNRILSEIREICIETGQNRWSYIQDKQEVVERLRVKIAELETLGIEKVKLEEAIQRILKKIEEDIRKVIVNTQLTETEKKIKKWIDSIRSELGRDTQTYNIPDYIQSGLSQLERLNVSEQDLIKARERVIRVMEQLVKAAEKLE